MLNQVTLALLIYISQVWQESMCLLEKKDFIMPQLVPFYYMNEIVFAFSLIVIILYILSKFILPRIVRLFLSRMFINNVFKSK